MTGDCDFAKSLSKHRNNAGTGVFGRRKARGSGVIQKRVVEEWDWLKIMMMKFHVLNSPVCAHVWD